MVLLLYGFMILWFYSFMVLSFYGFMVLLFCGFMVFGFYGFMVCIVLWFYGSMVSRIYQISISCFQEDIDPISMSSRFYSTFFHRFSGLSFPSPVQHSEILDFQNSDIYNDFIL